MKLKICITFILIINLIFFTNIVFAESDRIVDIPVPPDSSGYTDFTEEEAKQKAEEYEKNKSNLLTAEDYVNKSSNNYLKSLEVEGYKLEPKFNRQNSNYTIYTKSNTSKLKIKAEADDEKAKVEGIGEIEINQSENSINVNVIAENGDLKVYTININKDKAIINRNIIIASTTVIAIIIILIVFIKRKNNKKAR